MRAILRNCPKLKADRLMVSLVAEKINIRKYESFEASAINRCDCIYLFVDILIRPSPLVAYIKSKN